MLQTDAISGADAAAPPLTQQLIAVIAADQAACERAILCARRSRNVRANPTYQRDAQDRAEASAWAEQYEREVILLADSIIARAPIRLGCAS